MKTRWAGGGEEKRGVGKTKKGDFLKKSSLLFFTVQSSLSVVILLFLPHTVGVFCFYALIETNETSSPLRAFSVYLLLNKKRISCHRVWMYCVPTFYLTCNYPERSHKIFYLTFNNNYACTNVYSKMKHLR